MKVALMLKCWWVAAKVKKEIKQSFMFWTDGEAIGLKYIYNYDFEAS